ncbi:MAG: hypothetical protein J6Z11_13240, partial [Candidatus Riflebacteria bacterium]|nr:hypothetical protein [Candidatus Riflebacteria bacterium]
TLSFFLLLVGAVFKVFKNYEKEVIICCEQLYHNKDEGLFNVLNKLLGYQENAWFLSKETKTLLKRSIYECDYFYNMCPFPIIYTYQSDFNKIEKIRFLQDDNSVVIKGFKIGVVSLRNGKFKFIDHGTYNFDLIHENQTIVANDSKGVHFYNNQAHQISSFDIHGYQLVSHPQTNNFACTKDSDLSVYDYSGERLLSKKFNSYICCLAFSRSGNFLAVSTIDSVLSLLNIKTGEVVFQRKDSLPIVSIQCSEEESYFYAACWGDSTIIKKINMGSIHGDTILFKAPSGKTFERIKLSYTKSDYLAFSSGYEFILYNLRNGKICHSFPADIETLCMSPSGKKIAFSINGKIYIKEIKEKEAHFFPMKFYGYENVVGPSVAALYPNDSVVALSTILGKDKSGASELGLFNIYNGKSVGEKFVSHEPIWKIIPLPNSNKAAISEINHDCWEVVNFTNASIENIISPDTLNASSTLMLTANGKYLLGIFKKRLKGALLSLDGCRCLWSATNLQPVDSIYYLSGPLQDGEHLVKADAIYSYPKNEKIRQYADLIPSSKGEIFDGNKMAFWEGYYLSIIDINSDELLNYNLKPHLRGDFENYRLVGFKHGFALIFNGSHLMIVEIKDGDVILNQYVTSASFFNSKQSVLISTSMGLYKYDLLDYKEILYRWKQHLTWR